MIWAVDSEDNSKGKVYLINFYDGEKHHTFKKPSDAVQWLAKQPTRIEIWATNLGYDLSNIFQGNMGLLEITYIKGRVIQAKIPGTQVYFKDTLNHWKISVKEMGERIGLKKFKTEKFNNVRYCRRDTLITYNFVVEMKAKYEGFGAKLKSTIGSTALDLYYSRFGDKPHRPLFSTDTIDWMLGGYYGGRVEIFRTGKITGNIHYLDFNSLYPYCMRARDFPRLNGYRFRLGFREETEGIADCTVYVPRDLAYPYLPLRAKQGLIFPTGVFRGKWTHFELREFQKYGGKILKAHSCIEFRSTFKPFDDFVDSLYSQRLEAQKANDQLMSDALKLILNNLYGKFGQGNEITRLIPYNQTKLKHGDQMFDDLVLRNEIKPYPKHTNVIWAAYVTAYGRDLLYRAIKQVSDSGATPIYCDTDSIIFEGNNPFSTSKALGALKHEGLFQACEFKLPKLYRLIGETDITRAKGVPRNKADDFFEKGVAEFMRPNKLRESLRRKLTPNEWHLTRKEMRRTYDKRLSGKNGSTIPIIIDARKAREIELGAKRKDQRNDEVYRDRL